MDAVLLTNYCDIKTIPNCWLRYRHRIPILFAKEIIQKHTGLNSPGCRNGGKKRKLNALQKNRNFKYWFKRYFKILDGFFDAVIKPPINLTTAEQLIQMTKSNFMKLNAPWRMLYRPLHNYWNNTADSMVHRPYRLADIFAYCAIASRNKFALFIQKLKQNQIWF